MDNTAWVLGAPDPEMEAIETILRECGETVVYAVDARGERVHPGNAYRAHCPDLALDRIRSRGGVIYLVECDSEDERYGTHSPADADCAALVIRVDHHRPGDPGYGRPPEEFLRASSLGQVIECLADAGLLEHWPREEYDGHYSASFALHQSGWMYVGARRHDALRVPSHLVLTAAADHCLGAAYRGECPGVDPVALGEFRAAERAKFQGRPVSEVLADISETSAALERADMISLGAITSSGDCFSCGMHVLSLDGEEWGYCECPRVADMRRPEGPWPELPEAATRAGISYISGPMDCPDGRQKITCSGTRELVEAFMSEWAPRNGLTGIYGDPARGFAGGYLAP